jgi:hypothetical protein
VILRDLADKGCPTALLLEDDALPSEHWWEYTKRALEELDICAKNNSQPTIRGSMEWHSS